MTLSGRSVHLHFIDGKGFQISYVTGHHLFDFLVHPLFITSILLSLSVGVWLVYPPDDQKVPPWEVTWEDLVTRPEDEGCWSLKKASDW